MHAELEALLALQRQDAQRQEHERRIEHLVQRRDQLQGQLDRIAARHAQLHEALEAKRSEARRLTHEVDHLDAHIRNQEKKLATEIISLKEIEAIKTSLEHGHQRIEQLEDEALALMEEIERETEKLQAEDASFAKRKARFQDEIHKLEEEIRAQRERIAAIERERSARWDALTERLRAVYARLLDRVPDPLAPLEGQTCGGCHLQVSAQLAERVHENTGLVHCEHCGRVLYLIP